jgi:hypothetical protein
VLDCYSQNIATLVAVKYLATLRKMFSPVLLTEYSLRNLEPLYAFTRGSKKKAWWVCKVGHEWTAEIKHRVRGSGCPYCARRKASAQYNLAVDQPYLAAQWSRRNKLSPADYTPGSEQRVWWFCAAGHEWRATIKSRANGSKCPYCMGKKPSAEYNLAVSHPHLVAEWSSRNAKPPEEYTRGSQCRVWWQCSRGHKWQAPIANRTRLKQPTGCPVCRYSRPRK